MNRKDRRAFKKKYKVSPETIGIGKGVTLQYHGADEYCFRHGKPDDLKKVGYKTPEKFKLQVAESSQMLVDKKTKKRIERVRQVSFCPVCFTTIFLRETDYAQA